MLLKEFDYENNYNIKEIKSLHKYVVTYEYVILSEKSIKNSQLKVANVKSVEHKIVAKILNSNFEVEKRVEL